MSRGPDKMLKSIKQFTDLHYKHFTRHYAPQLIDILDFPVNVVLSPFTLAFGIAGFAPRGFGVPELISKLSYSAIFVVSTLGTYDLVFELGKKVLCQRDCRTCNGWQAMQCSMCKGSGTLQFQVKNYTLRSGEKATADAIAENRAGLVHLPSSVDPDLPLPSKECTSCNGSGVMKCPECNGKSPIRISTDDIMEPPWRASNILRKMDYPYEHIIDSMKDPSIAAFWLITLPQIVGGTDFDDDVKQKIWWQYKALISIDPIRAKDDPTIVKNVPYFKAKKALETEVMKLNPPSRPHNWGELDFPLNEASWTEEDFKDPKKLYEKTILLNAQREIADKILDGQWEAKWREEKFNQFHNGLRENITTQTHFEILHIIYLVNQFAPCSSVIILELSWHVFPSFKSLPRENVFWLSSLHNYHFQLNEMLKEKVEPYLQDRQNHPPLAYSSAITEQSPKGISAVDVGGYFDRVLAADDWSQYTFTRATVNFRSLHGSCKIGRVAKFLF